MAKPEDSSFSGHTSHRRRPLFAVGVEVRTVIPQISGDRSKKRRLESYVAGSILLTVSFNPGAFETQIHYVSRPVTKGQRLQPRCRHKDR